MGLVEGAYSFYARIATFFFGWLVSHKESAIVRQVPNMLTFSRVLVIPFGIAAAHALDAGDKEAAFWWLLAFSATAITDALDGAVARMLGVTSKFGALADPLLDKVLVVSALLIYMNHVALDGTMLRLVVGVIIIRLAVDGLLTLAGAIGAARKWRVGANEWGKIKFHFDMGAIVACFISLLAGSHALVITTSVFAIVGLLGASFFGLFSLWAHVRTT